MLLSQLSSTETFCRMKQKKCRLHGNEGWISLVHFSVLILLHFFNINKSYTHVPMCCKFLIFNVSFLAFSFHFYEKVFWSNLKALKLLKCKNQQTIFLLTILITFLQRKVPGWNVCKNPQTIFLTFWLKFHFRVSSYAVWINTFSTFLNLYVYYFRKRFSIIR